MHLLCLGVTRKLTNLWFKGPLQIQIGNRSRMELSFLLTSMISSVPMDFQRKYRGVDEVNR